jgi:hypothetical protein
VCGLESISLVISSNLPFALKSKQNNCCINRDYWEHNTTTRCLQVQNVTDLRLSYIETKSNIKEEEDEWSNNYQIRPLGNLQRKKSKLCSLDRMDPKHFLLALFEMMERKKLLRNIGKDSPFKNHIWHIWKNTSKQTEQYMWELIGIANPEFF